MCGARIGQVVNGPLDDPRDDELHPVDEEQADDTANDGPLVSCEVLEQVLEIAHLVLELGSGRTAIRRVLDALDVHKTAPDGVRSVRCVGWPVSS